MTPIRRRLWTLMLPAMGLMMGVPAYADTDPHDEIQRSDLALIQSQIAQIQHVVDRLEDRQAAANPATTRLYLDIPRLRRDLESISEGIDQYLSPARMPPRRVVPLDGDYIGGKR